VDVCLCSKKNVEFACSDTLQGRSVVCVIVKLFSGNKLSKCNGAMQDGIHAANYRTQQAIQAAMHHTYEYLISSLDEQPTTTEQNTGLHLVVVS